jgi:hypothetical protein
MNQCKFAASGFSANGGILGIWWGKVNSKWLFCLLFYAPLAINGV